MLKQTSIDLMKENAISLEKKKPRSRQYSPETITDVDYTDDLALLTYPLKQTERQMHIPEKATRSICLYVIIIMSCCLRRYP